MGVDRVKGHHLWAHFAQLKEQSMRRSKASIMRWNQEVTKAFAIVQTEKLANGASLILENITLLDDNAVNDLSPGGFCPFLGKEAWINTEGQFNPCCAPDNLRKSLGEFGSITHKPLQAIWQSAQYDNLRKNYLANALCQSCNMRKPLVG